MESNIEKRKGNPIDTSVIWQQSSKGNLKHYKEDCGNWFPLKSGDIYSNKKMQQCIYTNNVIPKEDGLYLVAPRRKRKIAPGLYLRPYKIESYNVVLKNWGSTIITIPNTENIELIPKIIKCSSGTLARIWLYNKSSDNKFLNLHISARGNIQLIDIECTITIRFYKKLEPIPYPQAHLVRVYNGKIVNKFVPKNMTLYETSSKDFVVFKEGECTYSSISKTAIIKRPKSKERLHKGSIYTRHTCRYINRMDKNKINKLLTKKRWFYNLEFYQKNILQNKEHYDHTSPLCKLNINYIKNIVRGDKSKYCTYIINMYNKLYRN